MGARDMVKADAFLKDFVSQLESRVPRKVDYILLGGSAARGDFQIGRSDMDLIVVVKKDADVQAVKDAAFALFHELDRKHGMMLMKAQESKGAVRIIGAGPGGPRSTRSQHGISGRVSGQDYPPFIVVGPSTPKLVKSDLFSSLDWLHGFSKSLRSSGLMSMKAIYGKPPQKQGAAKGPIVENPGIITYDLLSAAAMIPLSLVSPSRAFRRSLRAVFFSFESDIIRGIPLPLFAREAVYMKRHILAAAPAASYPEKVLFCLAAPLHILAHNIVRGMRPAEKPGAGKN